MPIERRFKLYERQDKGRKIREALQEAGYKETKGWRSAHLILADHDMRGELLQMYREHKKFFLYPHSVRSMIIWDGIIPPTSMPACNFVFAPGHKKVMELYGYKRPIEVMGWTYCPILPFEPIREIRNILFAPIHPNASPDPSGRRLMDIDQELNRRAFSRLHKLGIPLTVRYSGALEHNGLSPYPDVEYQVADLTLASSMLTIHNYDLIVGHQTFAYLAIASGKPTVMFGEDVPPHSMHVQVRSWEKYKHLLKFPLDLLVGNPGDVLTQAASSEDSILEWKYNFIGKSFSSSCFLETLERYM
jgi:hypothetical protein